MKKIIVPKPLIDLGINQRYPEEIILGKKASGFEKPKEFTGYYPINPYVVIPRFGDVIINAQASKEVKRFHSMDAPYRGDYHAVNQVIRLINKPSLAVKSPEERLKDAWDSFYKSILATKCCVYRKILYDINYVTTDKSKTYIYEIIDDNEIIKPYDMISSYCLIENEDMPMLVEPALLIIGHSPIFVSPDCPDVGKTLGSFKQFINSEEDRLYIYRMLVAGPYGLSRRLPLNESYSQALPLP